MPIKALPAPIQWHDDLSIYASEKFLAAVSDEYGWLGGYDSFGEMRCLLPYTVVKKLNIRMARFRVETLPIGTMISIDEEKSFLNSVVQYLRSIKADMIIPASTNSVFRTYPNGAIAAPYGTLIINLDLDENVLWNNLNPTYRKKIRNSIKKGVLIKTGLEYLEISQAIIRDTLRRSSLGFMSSGALNQLVKGLGDNVKIFVAEYQGTIQGCTIFPFSGHSAYSLYGGRRTDAEAGAMNLLNWEAMRCFQRLRVRKFDFMGVRINPEPGSKQEGITTFKQRFGAHLLQGYLWKYPIHKLKYGLYNMASRFRRGGDIVDAEKHKLSNLRPLEGE
ncbi:MAG: peptidoglycan bridge formation glycyltransferase FemA/FemB family protein [Planctomycetes bacterium]|nr:peptidoglycan bridge formation glycyltransferase FemA/FemB family protein [Planctomycetota bacterium]